jgi:hypothetical protein
MDGRMDGWTDGRRKEYRYLRINSKSKEFIKYKQSPMMRKYERKSWKCVVRR